MNIYRDIKEVKDEGMHKNLEIVEKWKNFTLVLNISLLLNRKSSGDGFKM